MTVSESGSIVLLRVIVWNVSISFLELFISDLLGTLSSAETVVDLSLAIFVWPWYTHKRDMNELVARDMAKDTVTEFGWKAKKG